MFEIANCYREGAVVEYVRGRLINRDGAGVGSGIGLFLSDVQLQGFESVMTHDHCLLLLW